MDLYKGAASFPRALDRGRPVLTAQHVRGVSQNALANRVHKGVAHRLFRGAYVFGVAPPTFVERARAALLVSPPGTVLGFDSAAALHGFGILDTSTIHIVVPAGISPPQRSGIRAHQSTMPSEAVTRWGMLCTTPARTAIDLVRTLPRMAVCRCSMPLCSPARVPGSN